MPVEKIPISPPAHRCSATSHWRAVGGLALMALLLAMSDVHLLADPAEPGAPGSETTGESTALYSGVECLQQAMRLLGQPVDMIQLLSSPLLAAQEDSPQVLVHLASQQNLHTVLLDQLAKDQIVRCPYPILIHARGGRYSAKPDYYVLSTGIREGNVELFTPASGQLRVPLSQLDEDRFGEAVVLSRDPLPANATFLHRAFPIANCTLMVGVLLSFAAFAIARSPRHLQFPHRQESSSAVQFAIIVVIACVLTDVGRFASGESLVPAPPASFDFLLGNQAHAEKPSAKLSEIDLQTALRLSRTDALFVDARDIPDYNAGHIRGAIVCPATDLSQWHLHLAGIDPSRRIVVYCAQASCGKADYVATFLLANGFTDVSLYRDGWAKWTGAREAR
jgi:rhodanese-related sulfurtransferase